jgi:hypothetical protein
LRLSPPANSITSPPALFNRSFQIKNNVVVFWTNLKIASASRSVVLGCLS